LFAYNKIKKGGGHRGNLGSPIKKIEKKKETQEESTRSKERSINTMNVTMNMSQVMSNMMKGMACSITSQVVEACAAKYGFCAEEALRDLGVTICTTAKKEKVIKPKKQVAAFPLPFNGEHNPECCQALRQNNGLYTQCQSAKNTGDFCKSCNQLASKSEDGIPEYGTISQRLACELFAYIDPKGRKPTGYTKVMKKYKLNEEQVQAEAAKFGITINPLHFVAPEETKRGRPAAKAEKVAKAEKAIKGRPKKTNKVVMIDDDDDDLFASLVASAAEPDEEDAEEKAFKKAEKAAQIAAEKAEKAEKLAAEKAEKEAKLAAAKAEKEAKLALEKAEKEAKLAAAKAEKEAKLAKAEQEKAEKTAKLAAEKAEKEAKIAAAKAAKEKKTKKVVAEEEPEETYKKCGQVNGVNYIRSQQTGIVYNFDVYAETEELNPVGKWNAEQKTIIFDKSGADDSDLSEDEVDDE